VNGTALALGWDCMVSGDLVQRKGYRLRLWFIYLRPGRFLSTAASRCWARSLENKDAICSARVLGLDGRDTTKTIVG
jgi:hypothetical protein